jgi:hypothetical protein
MGKDNSGPGSCVVVVGDPGGELVQTTVRLARERETDTVTCDDVYAAVAQIAKAAGRRVLALGTMQELAGENGAFFRIAAANGIRCCCLLDQVISARRSDLLAALGGGATIFGDVQDVRSLLDQWLAPPQGRGSPRILRDASQARRLSRDGADASYEEFRATEAELSALLE